MQKDRKRKADSHWQTNRHTDGQSEFIHFIFKGTLNQEYLLLERLVYQIHSVHWTSMSFSRRSIKRPGTVLKTVDGRTWYSGFPAFPTQQRNYFPRMYFHEKSLKLWVLRNDRMYILRNGMSRENTKRKRGKEKERKKERKREREMGEREQSCPRGRMNPWVGSGFCRVGSGWVTILPELGGSGSALRIFQFLLIIFWCLNRYESSNTTFGLIDLLWYI